MLPGVNKAGELATRCLLVGACALRLLTPELHHKEDKGV